jgi:hypothetical protein
MIVVAGGVMPDEDVAALKKMGVREVMLQDTPPQAIIDKLRQLVSERGPAMMENWSFPAIYDENYFPAPASATGSRHVRRCPRPIASARSSSGCRSSALTLTSTRLSTSANGTRPAFHPSKLKSLEDFEKIPVVQKKDLREAQARVPPFGDYLCVPRATCFISMAPAAPPDGRPLCDRPQ